MAMEELDHLRIPLEDIRQATNNFAEENIIGRDGYGNMYKGKLVLSQGFVTCAIKRIDRRFGQGKPEFWKEISVLSRCRHENIISLVGFCEERGEMIVVLELQNNGSLDKYLSSEKLTWLMRLRICLGVARGLDFLHNGQEGLSGTTHRDIKSANILIGENWDPKIANLGLSKLFWNQGGDVVFTDVCGTLGYVDPVYMETGSVTTAADIYSFGVVLSEVLCGRMELVSDGDRKYRHLVPLVRRHHEEGTITEIVDPFLRNQMNLDSLNAFTDIAYQCLQHDRFKRPTINHIVERLEDLLQKELDAEQDLDPFRIPLEEIKRATRDFDQKSMIARGGYGCVYKGELWRPEGVLMCAFKRLDRMFGQGSHEFYQEIKILCRYRHENIVSLVGFCNEGAEFILVYQFITHGSLDQYLTSAKLTWLKRIEICLGAARGLNYLHDPQGSLQRVLHRDLKSMNILLDENWHAKIADFGLSKVGPANTMNTFLITNPGGTLGYIDPSYMKTGVLTKESDIYSFGVILFEVLCSRLAITTADNGIGRFLSKFASHHYENGTLDEIIDPILRKQMNQDSLNIYSAIAYQCLQSDREERPPILDIVKKLEKALSLQHEFEKAPTVQQVDQAVEVEPTDEDDYIKKKNLEHWKIPYEEIYSATNKLNPDDDHHIGSGSFGEVYKAELFHFDVREYFRESEPRRSSMVELYGYPRRKSEVAIKRLHKDSEQGRKEFLQEIKVLSRLNHENLVSLLGFCDEKGEMMLVYEYAPNGSLDKCIQKIQKGDSPPWQRRLEICLDMAHGLNYLHKHNVQHRDMKSGNILLGHNWKGMIADFGFARIKKHENSQLSKASVVGTPFCIHPRYVRTGTLSNLSDIYPLGVILLEILFGRQASTPDLPDDPEYLVHEAERHFQNKQLLQNIDRHLREELEKSSSNNFLDSINTFVAITYQCLHSTQEHQLTMESVVLEIKRALIFHSIGVEALPLKAIHKATNCFSEEHVIGIGASGKVYKGELSLSNGPKEVAVKKLNMAGSYGEGAFLKEVTMLSRYIHDNIIPLRGFCEEGNEKIIIFERATNGSLDKHLDNPTLTWGLRLKISISAAKGLHYIHTFDEAQYTPHGDIKSSNILLDHDWKATISDFIIAKGNFGTLGYIDPLQSLGGVTKESDVYSFGVVLFEILTGRLAIERVGKYPKDTLHHIITIEPESNAGEAIRDEQVVFLAQVAARCFEDNILEAITFNGIKEQTDAKSIYMLSDIAYQCLRSNRAERPTMAQVLEALENAYRIHDEWESEKKLPADFEKIIKMSRYPMSSTMKKKDLYSLLCSGILLEKEKVWFSISTDGVVNQTLSAKKLSYVNVPHLKWRSNRKSRFSKVAKVLDISNLNIRVQTRIQHLSPEMMYGAYLVFKFCDQRKVSSRPLYVNLEYRKAREDLNAYFAEWKAGSNWLTVELFRFSSNKGSVDFDILLKGFSQYYCGNGGIFVEGIEFQAITRVDFEEKKVLKDEKIDGIPLELESFMEQDGQVGVDYDQIIKRSGNDVQNATKEELNFLLSDGILIDNGEKLISLSKVNKKICHMLPAKAVLQNSAQSSSNSSNIKFCKPSTGSRCKFGEVAEIISHQDLRIKCDVEMQMLSSDTKYGCFLVFKLSEKCHGLNCPVKARDLMPNRKERTKIMMFTAPSTVNLDKIKWIPNEREDGWMEVIVWETVSENKHGDDYVPMDLKLITFEGTMAGLIVYGIEFRPIEENINNRDVLAHRSKRRIEKNVS